MTGRTDWRRIIRDDIKAGRRETPIPWWHGWFYKEEVIGLAIVLAWGFFVACLIWGGSR